MELLGQLAVMVVVAYAFGTAWYHVLGHPSSHWLRMVAYPLVGIIIGEGLWVSYMVAGPELLGVHVVVALFATFLGVSLDIVVKLRVVPFRYIENLTINGNKSRGKNAKVEASAVAKR